jgi:hypothetical protein
MKLLVRAAILTLCVAGAAASAMTSKSTPMASHQVIASAQPAPTNCPGTGSGWGQVFR